MSLRPSEKLPKSRRLMPIVDFGCCQWMASHSFDNFQHSMGKILLRENAIWAEPSAVLLSILHGRPFPRYQFNHQCNRS